jgi:hypothetical protein
MQGEAVVTSGVKNLLITWSRPLFLLVLNPQWIRFLDQFESSEDAEFLIEGAKLLHDKALTDGTILHSDFLLRPFS